MDELNKETISLAVNKKYSDFSTNIKSVLSKKLEENPVYSAHVANINRMKGMKDAFSKICGNDDKSDKE